MCRQLFAYFISLLWSLSVALDKLASHAQGIVSCNVKLWTGLLQISHIRISTKYNTSPITINFVEVSDGISWKAEGWQWKSRPAQAQAEPFRRLHVIAKPGLFLDDLAEETYGKSNREKRAINRRVLDSAIAIYRSLGFRRIGSSSCFGFSVDPKHKAHSIKIDADYDPSRVNEELEISDDEIAAATSFNPRNEVIQKKLAKLKQIFPPEHAINTLPDAELVASFKTFGSKNGTGWKEINSRHNNVRHQTGCALKISPTK